MAWKFAAAPQFGSRLRQWEQRSACPQTQVINNLHSVFSLLVGSNGTESLRIDDSFVTTYDGNVYSVCQTGTGHRSDQISGAVYFYPDEMTQTIHVITIGDDETHNEDLIYARSYVAGIIVEPFANKRIAS